MALDQSEKENPDLAKRLFAFSLRIIRLCKQLCRTPGAERLIGQQLLKAGTSVGANYEEAQAGQSRADFISKCSICLREARESHYWLRLVVESELMARNLLEDLVDEAGQIAKIFGSIVSRTRRNSK